jgi:hypothetical protein
VPKFGLHGYSRGGERMRVQGSKVNPLRLKKKGVVLIILDERLIEFITSLRQLPEKLLQEQGENVRL